MSDRRAEIELELELLDLEEKFIAAKATGDRNHPDRVAFSQARIYWRQIREAVAAGLVPEESTTKKGKG
jgi:hypothetical protein